MPQPLLLRSMQRARNIQAISALFLLLLAIATIFIIFLVSAAAQENSRITSVDPTFGKVNDSVTATGDGPAKGTASRVFLSDGKND
jgi:hypothetical protein